MCSVYVLESKRSEMVPFDKVVTCWINLPIVYYPLSWISGL